MAKQASAPQIAFTTKYDKKTQVLFTKIGISPYKAGQRIEKNPQYEGIAVWDTGATGTVITPKVASALKLNPVGKKEIHGVGGKLLADEYLVNIYLPNHVQIMGIPVLQPPGILGDFAVSNHNNRTKLSYQMPSTHDIDFVEEINRLKKNKQINARLKSDRLTFERAKRKSRKKS